MQIDTTTKAELSLVLNCIIIDESHAESSNEFVKTETEDEDDRQRCASKHMVNHATI